MTDISVLDAASSAPKLAAPREDEIVPDVFVETVTDRVGQHVLASAIRPATRAEVLAAKKKFDDTGRCECTIVHDIKGWLYDMRQCHICGGGLGSV